MKKLTLAILVWSLSITAYSQVDQQDKVVPFMLALNSDLLLELLSGPKMLRSDSIPTDRTFDEVQIFFKDDDAEAQQLVEKFVEDLKALKLKQAAHAAGQPQNAFDDRGSRRPIDTNPLQFGGMKTAPGPDFSDQPPKRTSSLEVPNNNGVPPVRDTSGGRVTDPNLQPKTSNPVDFSPKSSSLYRGQMDLNPIENANSNVRNPTAQPQRNYVEDYAVNDLIDREVADQVARIRLEFQQAVYDRDQQNQQVVQYLNNRINELETAGYQSRGKTDVQTPSFPSTRMVADVPGNADKQATSTDKSNLTGSQGRETFLYFMLFGSIGLNVYLGLLARSFYARYEDLADELRETFTSTT